MNADTHADSGKGTGGGGTIRGKYYPVKGGSSSNFQGTNAAWSPKPSGTAVGRGLDDVSPRSRRDFVHGGGEYGSGGTRAKPASSMMGTTDGATGPDGSGNGTSHEKSDWFSRNKNNTGSGSGCMGDGQTSNSNAGGLSSTTPYGSGDFGKSKTRKA